MWQCRKSQYQWQDETGKAVYVWGEWFEVQEPEKEARELADRNPDFLNFREVNTTSCTKTKIAIWNSKNLLKPCVTFDEGLNRYSFPDGASIYIEFNRE